MKVALHSVNNTEKYVALNIVLRYNEEVVATHQIPTPLSMFSPKTRFVILSGLVLAAFLLGQSASSHGFSVIPSETEVLEWTI